MRIASALLLCVALSACGTEADAPDAPEVAAAALTDEAPVKVAAGDGCKRSAEHAKAHGEDCDCSGCDKEKGEAHASAHGDAAHASAHGHGDAAHAHGDAVADCACKSDKADHTAWCDGCNTGFINGEATNDKAAVQAALEAGV